MNSMRIGRNKQNSSEVKLHPPNQHLPQQSLQKSKNSTIKSHQKKVQFNCQIPLKKQETSENRKYNPARPFEFNQAMSEDYAPMSSSMNMFPSK